MNIRRAAALRRNVQVTYGRDAVEAILKRSKSRRLGEQHEQAVHALVQVRVSFRLEELHTEICQFVLATAYRTGHVEVSYK